jgi:hypothetical protein
VLDLVQLDAQIEDDRWAQTFAGEAGARPARDERQVVLEAVPDEYGDILNILRDGDGRGHDLEGAGVGCVETAREGVEVQCPSKAAAKVIGELLGIEHWMRFGFVIRLQVTAVNISKWQLFGSKVLPGATTYDRPSGAPIRP